MIPRTLVRTVPEHTSEETEELWRIATGLHPEWEWVTLRDPIDRDGFPITSPHWDNCQTGAQLADLVRAEYLYHNGGVYIDSDYLCWKSFDTLVSCGAFAAWEDDRAIPNAVMGFAPGHPALAQILGLAVARQSLGTWEAGVGVTTEVFKGRDDILLLPPGVFYPVHYTHKALITDLDQIRGSNPWAFGVHLWHHSWRTDNG